MTESSLRKTLRSWPLKLSDCSSPTVEAAYVVEPFSVVSGSSRFFSIDIVGIIVDIDGVNKRGIRSLITIRPPILNKSRAAACLITAYYPTSNYVISLAPQSGRLDSQLLE